jgi:hypothetical protein
MSGKNSTERHIFLFDHLLVICKTIKSNKGATTFKYKEQFDIRKIDIFDLEDEEGERIYHKKNFLDVKNAFPLKNLFLDMKNAFRVRSGQKEIHLFCQTYEDKVDWMTSLVEMQTAG